MFWRENKNIASRARTICLQHVRGDVGLYGVLEGGDEADESGGGDEVPLSGVHDVITVLCLACGSGTGSGGAHRPAGEGRVFASFLHNEMVALL